MFIKYTETAGARIYESVLKLQIITNILYDHNYLVRGTQISFLETNVNQVDIQYEKI